MIGVEQTFTAFVDDRRLVSGRLRVVLRSAKTWLDGAEAGRLLIFDDQTGEQIDFDWRGSIIDVLSRAAAPARGKRVLRAEAGNVSLLPRHWAWLREQPNGASGALRALIEAEMESAPELHAGRRARDATNAVMTALAGDRQGFEEAARALYRGDFGSFSGQIAPWPPDIRAHLLRIASRWFELRGEM
jgi:hypothetical protein